MSTACSFLAHMHMHVQLFLGGGGGGGRSLVFMGHEVFP